MGRGDLSDVQWDLVKGLMPLQGRGGKWNDHRVTLDGILWILRTGAPWRDLPERYGKWKSVYDRFNSWRKDGMYARLLRALRIRLDKEGKIDWDLWLVDGSNVRASRAAAGAGKKREKPSRKTTHWAAREAGGDPSSTWSLTVREFPWPRSSAPDRRTSRRASSK
jgi:transposase